MFSLQYTPPSNETLTLRIRTETVGGAASYDLEYSYTEP